MAKIIHTDNFGRDYPDEKFVTGLPTMSDKAAETICAAINSTIPPDHSRYFKVVPNDYVLKPGFEP